MEQRQHPPLVLGKAGAEAVGQRGTEGLLPALAFLVGEVDGAVAQGREVRLQPRFRVDAVAQRLAHRHQDRQRVAAGEAEQRAQIRQGGEAAAVAVGQGAGELQPLPHRHRRHRHPRRQVAEPPPLVAAGGEQHLGLGLAQVGEEPAQRLLLLPAPLRLAAGGEAGDRLDIVPDPQHRDLPQHLDRQVPALVCIGDRVPMDPAPLQQRAEHRAKLVQHPGQRPVALEAGEQHLPLDPARLDPARLAVPAGELRRRRGLAAAGVGVEKDDPVDIEGAVEGVEGLVAAVEAHIRPRRQFPVERSGPAAAVGLQRDGERGGVRRRRPEAERRPLPHHRHRPVLERPGLIGHLPQRLVGEVGPGRRHRLAQGPAAGQRRVQPGDELRRGDDIDGVAHRHHPGGAGIHHRLGERAVGLDLLPHRPGGGLLRLGRRLGEGRLAGVENEQRHARVRQQPADPAAVDELGAGVGGGVLEHQEAALPGGRGAGVELEAAQHRAGPFEVLRVGVGAVAVEVDDVVGPAGVPGGAQHLAEPREGRRAQHVEVEALADLPVQLRHQLAGDGAERHVRAGPGPADDQEDADLFGGLGLGGQERPDRPRLAANERLRRQRQGLVRAGIADQLPGDGGGLGDPGLDLDAGGGEVLADGRPQVAGVVGALEQGGEQLIAKRRHPRLDPGGELRRRVLVELQVVLQVPAEVGAVLGGEGEVEGAVAGARVRGVSLVCSPGTSVGRGGPGGFGLCRRRRLRRPAAPPAPRRGLPPASCRRRSSAADGSSTSPRPEPPLEPCPPAGPQPHWPQSVRARHPVGKTAGSRAGGQHVDPPHRNPVDARRGRARARCLPVGRAAPGDFRQPAACRLRSPPSTTAPPPVSTGRLEAFPVLGQAAASSQPGEGALDKAAFGQHDEALGLI